MSWLRTSMANQSTSAAVSTLWSGRSWPVEASSVANIVMVCRRSSRFLRQIAAASGSAVAAPAPLHEHVGHVPRVLAFHRGHPGVGLLGGGAGGLGVDPRAGVVDGRR